jgi:lysophospholipase L1-like esterase
MVQIVSTSLILLSALLLVSCSTPTTGPCRFDISDNDLQASGESATKANVTKPASGQGLPLIPGDYTIVCFGDSTTAPREGFVVYAENLRKMLPAYEINAKVINVGVGGENTSEGLVRFSEGVLNHDPHIVIIQFGINDAAVDLWKSPPATGPQVSLQTFTDNMTYFVQSLKKQGATVILMTANAMTWTEELLSLFGNTPYLPEERWGFNVMLSPYNQAVRDIARKEHVPLIDVFRMCIEYDSDNGQNISDLLSDGMHPNSKGHRLISDELIRRIAGATPP